MYNKIEIDIYEYIDLLKSKLLLIKEIPTNISKKEIKQINRKLIEANKMEEKYRYEGTLMF